MMIHKLTLLFVLVSIAKAFIVQSARRSAVQPLNLFFRDSSSNKVSVLVCPAQFCVPVDYDPLFANLMKELGEDRVGSCRVAPLPRTEWIKVARSLPTRDYLGGTLKNHKVLSWYFAAIEKALDEIFTQEGENAKIALIGHSIGGWVARAYLGGLSLSSSPVHQLAQKRISSYLTLGTPHRSPQDAFVDQTRGLLREVELTEACSPQALKRRGIDVTCVGSASLSGRFSTNLEELVAASSYFPLLGHLDDSIRGDGIVPTELAFMDAPSRRIELEACPKTGDKIRHAPVFPTPWNLINGSAPSIPLNFTWYGSEGVIGQWAQYVR
jgi:hypothetical protein